MVKHLQRRGVGIKDYPDMFDTPENNREEILQLRGENKDLRNQLVASRKETADLKNECSSKNDEIVRLYEIIAQLESENKELRERIDKLAQFLADALRNIENEESAMEMLRVAFTKLPAGTAFDVFGSVSKLLGDNRNWSRIQPVIYHELNERLFKLEKAAMNDRQTNMNVAGDFVLNKETKNE